LAFHPLPIPFPLLHVDTGFDFQDMYTFRDEFIKKIGAKLLVYRNEEAIADNANPFRLGTFKCCDLLRTKPLVQALKHFNVDAAIGGARREEEKSRAKERVFSFRDMHGGWNPKAQRPEPWKLYNGRILPGEGVRIFPLSDWTELDIWQYIKRESIPIVPLYFAAEREVIDRGKMIIPADQTRAGNGLLPGEKVVKMMIRYRTLGCSPCTGAIRSNAETVDQIITEMLEANISERSTRVIDHDQEGSMEKKKMEGYF
jgi:sulfate adenylyltransferase subunit 2